MHGKNLNDSGDALKHSFLEHISQRCTYVIAEIGINHCGDLERALFLIEEAKKAGADAVKFQTFKTELLVRQNEPKMPYQVRPEEIENQFQMLKRVELDEKSHRALIEKARALNIDFISTPYDPESADLLVRLGVSTIKIASTDTTNIPLLRHVAKFPVNLIISTGVTDLWELQKSVASLGERLHENVALLHCLSNYPAPVDEINLKCIQSLKDIFECPIGFSDHTSDVNVGAYAVCAGATILEKHFTFDKKAKGPDHLASFTPAELKIYIEKVRYVEKCLGNGIKTVANSEKKIKERMQKSLVAREDLKAGDILNEKTIWTMRPATGISPLYVDELIGKKLKKAKGKFEEISWEDLS